MDNTKISKYTTSFGLSLAITSLLSALLVVAKEKSPHTVMVWMKNLTGQHWVTHSSVAVVLFVILGLVFAQLNRGQGIKLSANRLIIVLTGGVIIGALIIAGFYLYDS